MAHLCFKYEYGAMSCQILSYCIYLVPCLFLTNVIIKSMLANYTFWFLQQLELIHMQLYL